MAAPVVRLLFTDGGEAEAKLNPRIMVEVERHFGGVIPPYEGTLYGAWHRLGRPGGKFEDWLDTVEEIDQSDGAADPSGPEASDGS